MPAPPAVRRPLAPIVLLTLLLPTPDPAVVARPAERVRWPVMISMSLDIAGATHRDEFLRAWRR